MKITKVVLAFLVISCFLLNSTTALAAYTPDQAGRFAEKQSIEQVLSPKDEAILKKFNKAKQWLDEQTLWFKDILAETMVKFREEMGRVSQELKAKFQELKDRITNEYYTLMKGKSNDILC